MSPSAEEPTANADDTEEPRLPLSRRLFSSLMGRRCALIEVGRRDDRLATLARRASPGMEVAFVETEGRRGGEPLVSEVSQALARASAGPLALHLGGAADAAVLVPNLAAELSRLAEPLLWVQVPSGEPEFGAESLVSHLEQEGWIVRGIDDVRERWVSFNRVADPQYRGQVEVLVGVRSPLAVCACFFTHSSSLNGAERTILDAVRYAVRHHDLLATVVVPAPGPLADRLAEVGVPSIVAPYGWWCDTEEVDELRAEGRLLESAAVVLEDLVPQLREAELEVVVTLSMVIPWGAVAAARLGRPHVWYVTEFGTLDHGLRFFLPFDEVLATVDRTSDRVLTVSEAVRRQLFAELAKERCRTVYPYLEAPVEYTAAGSREIGSADAFLLGNFHTLAPGKDQETLVQAVAELVARGRDVELLLAGGADAGYRRRIEQLVTRHGLSRRVHLLGFVEDPYPLMTRCDAIVAASAREAFGRTVIEAALLGRPVLYAASGGYLESMRDGETGLAFPVADAAALADSVEELIRDPALAARLSDGARRHARDFVDQARPDRLLLPLLREVASAEVHGERAHLPELLRLTSLRRFLVLQQREAAALRAVQEELQKQIESLLAVSSRVSELQRRVEEGDAGGAAQQRRPSGRPQVDTATAESRRRFERLVHHLQDSIDHVAADGAELRRQVADLVGLLENRRDSGELVPPVPQARTGVDTSAWRRTLRGVKRLLRPAYRGSRALAGRARRAALRRLPVKSSHRTGDELRLDRGETRAVAFPALSVVIPTDRLERAARQRLLAALRRQTVTSVEWVLWSEAGASAEVLDPAWRPVESFRTDRPDELRASLRGAAVAMAHASSAALPESWYEVATWSLLTEDLPIVRLALEDSTGRRVRHADPSVGDGMAVDLLVVRRDVWTPQGIDAAALRRIASGPPAVLGRLIRHVGDFGGSATDSGPVLPGAADELVRPFGDHLLPAGRAPSLYQHSIHPLDEVLREDPVADVRHTVLVLLPFVAIGGAEKLTYDLMRQLEDRFRFIVVTLAPHQPVLGNRLDSFRQLTPHVYLLGEAFLHPLLFSVVSHLLRKYQVKTLFNANGTTWFYEALPSLRRQFPELAIVNQLFDHREGWIEYYHHGVVEDCDVHLATNSAIESTLLREHGVPESKLRHIPHGIDLDDFRPAEYTPDRLALLRNQLEIPEAAILVTMAVRMHPQKRPEDFVALAHEMRSDADFFFLLVGGGPLESTVQDLADYYVLPNFKRVGFYTPIADLLAITDVACMMSEYEALPLYLLSALAMHKPVVSTAVGAIATVLGQGPCGVVVPRIADLAAFRSALLGMKDPVRRRELGLKGRELVEKAFAIESAAQEYARVLVAARRSS